MTRNELMKFCKVMSNLPATFSKSDYEKVARHDPCWYVSIDKLERDGYIMKCGEENMTIQVDEPTIIFADGYKMPRQRFFGEFNTIEQNALKKAHGAYDWQYEKRDIPAKRYLYCLNKDSLVEMTTYLLSLIHNS